MREYSKRPENQSRTSDSNPRASQQAPIDTILQRSEKKEKPNDTGLPDNLKSGVENLSGHSLDDVKVHYNSNKPAQLQALAYTQGTDIHVAPGQERHLPHEAWHVVQQKQGRVQPTLQLQGVNVNDDDSLEREADVMGRNALQMKRVRNKNTDSIGNDTIQMVKVYVIEDTNIFGTPKTTFLTAAAGRVNNKQAAADTTHAPKIVDEFHIATRARARAKATATATGSAPPVPDVTVDETQQVLQGNE